MVINTHLRAIYFLALFFFYGQKGVAQDQHLADSAKLVLAHRELNLEEQLNTISYISAAATDPDEVLSYSELLIKLAQKKNMPEYECKGYMNLGHAYKLKGEMQKAIEAFLAAVNIAEKRNDLIGKGDALGSIGLVHSSSKDFTNAHKYYLMANAIFEMINDTLRLSVNSTNIGYALYKAGKYDSAIQYLQISYDLANSFDNKIMKAYADANLALVLARTGDFDSASVRLNRALTYFRKSNDSYAMADCLVELGGILLDRNEIEAAINKTLEGFKIAKKEGFKEQIQNGAKYLFEAYKRLGNYPLALLYQSEFYEYKDSLTNAESIRKMADLRTEYEVGQKQAEVNLLTAEKKTQRVIMIAIGVFALVVIILALVIYNFYRSKARINRELERLNHTKDKFFSIISHDLRGPVSSFHGISRMIKYLVTTRETNQLLEVADDIDQSVDRLSSLLDNLLTWAMQQQGHFPNVPEKLYLKELTGDLVKTLTNMASGKNIRLTSGIDEETILWADRNMTMTILRNLVSNALKFTPEGGSVTISARQKSDFAEISISDTGVGIPQEKVNKLFTLQDKKSTYGTSGEKGLGLGLQLVYEFIELNGGKIAVKSEEGKGTVFTVSLPLFEVEKTVIEN